ncbi:hypothetical protein [Spirillospora sp. NPDC048819]|uniref:hypothetical protein n=1 Tax=Spirillospora sp. NPDC048819 TaxID=3155268 RepID=UPI0033F2E775
MSERQSAIVVAAVGALQDGWVGLRVREALGLLVAADARVNQWMVEVGKSQFGPDEFLTFGIEYAECCDEVEAAWDRYRAHGFPEALEAANALPAAEERTARHEQLSPQRHAAQEELLAVLLDVTERMRRLIEGGHAESRSHKKLG